MKDPVPIRGWVGSRAGLNGCEKSRTPPPSPIGIRSDPRAVQPVANRYTDWAIPVHPRHIEHWNLLLVLSDWIPFFWQKRRSGSALWDLRASLLKIIEERRLSSGSEGSGGRPIICGTARNVGFLANLSFTRPFFSFCRSLCHLLILDLWAILLYKAPLFGFQAVFTKTPLSSFHGLFAVL